MLRREDTRGQGRHVDPEDATPPDVSWWGDAQRAAWRSPHMATLADVLRPPAGGSVRDGVLADLAEYHQLTPDQVIDRCVRWEEASVQEWQAATDLADFYNSIDSWTFDLLWYAYLQTAGYGTPNAVMIADQLDLPPAGARMLDLGSGVGVTAQFFAALGYDVTLADVSTTLLNFARWRLERRGVKAAYLQLPTDLPEDRFDLITALDVMAHVPDPAETAQRLHRALRPGGLFVANFDVRRHSPQNAWHLYEDDLPLRWAIQRAGFVPTKLIDDTLWVFVAVPTAGTRWRIRRAFAWMHLASPPVRALRASRRALSRAAVLAITRVRARQDRPHSAS